MTITMIRVMLLMPQEYPPADQRKPIGGWSADRGRMANAFGESSAYARRQSATEHGGDGRLA